MNVKRSGISDSSALVPANKYCNSGGRLALEHSICPHCKLGHIRAKIYTEHMVGMKI